MDAVPTGQRVSAPERGKALVYFVRTTKYQDTLPADLYDGDNYIGTILYGEHIAYQAKPGHHMFMVTGKIIDTAEFMEAKLKVGKTYYAVLSPHLGWAGGFTGRMIARFHFNPQNGSLSQQKIDNAIRNSRQLKAGKKAQQYAAKQETSMRKKKARSLPRWQQSTEKDKRVLR